MGGTDKEYTKAELDGLNSAKLKEIADGLCQDGEVAGPLGLSLDTVQGRLAM